MEISDFFLMRRGWNDKLLYEQSLQRRSTLGIMMSFGVKPKDADKYWPDPQGTRKSKMVIFKGVSMTEKQMKRLIKLEPKKNG